MARKKRQKYNQGSRVSHRNVQALNEQKFKSDIARLGRAVKVGVGVIGAARSAPFAIGLAGIQAYKGLKNSSDNPSPTKKVVYSGGFGTHGISVPNPRRYRKINKLDKI